MNTIKKLGIDPSINSTGICLSVFEDDCETPYNYYWLITSHLTKNMKNIPKHRIDIIEYNHESQKGLSGIEKELVKSHNVFCVGGIIRDIINKEKPNKIYIEGISFGSSGTLDQLSGLNYMIRNIVIDYAFSSFCDYKEILRVVPPTTVKMLSVGNGQATKDSIINTWKYLDNEMYENTKNIKHDDLADAYMLSILNL